MNPSIRKHVLGGLALAVASTGLVRPAAAAANGPEHAAAHSTAQLPFSITSCVDQVGGDSRLPDAALVICKAKNGGYLAWDVDHHGHLIAGGDEVRFSDTKVESASIVIPHGRVHLRTGSLNAAHLIPSYFHVVANRNVDALASQQAAAAVIKEIGREIEGWQHIKLSHNYDLSSPPSLIVNTWLAPKTVTATISIVELNVSPTSVTVSPAPAAPSASAAQAARRPSVAFVAPRPISGLTGSVGTGTPSLPAVSTPSSALTTLLAPPSNAGATSPGGSLALAVLALLTVGHLVGYKSIGRAMRRAYVGFKVRAATAFAKTSKLRSFNLGLGFAYLAVGAGRALYSAKKAVQNGVSMLPKLNKSQAGKGANWGDRQVFTRPLPLAPSVRDLEAVTVEPSDIEIARTLRANAVDKMKKIRSEAIDGVPFATSYSAVADLISTLRPFEVSQQTADDLRGTFREVADFVSCWGSTPEARALGEPLRQMAKGASIPSFG